MEREVQMVSQGKEGLVRMQGEPQDKMRSSVTVEK